MEKLGVKMPAVRPVGHEELKHDASRKLQLMLNAAWKERVFPLRIFCNC